MNELTMKGGTGFIMDTRGSADFPYIPPGGELPLSNQDQLELLLALSERGAGFRVKALGRSMSPFIRDGDILTIVPFKGESPRAGQVVAVMIPRFERFAVHRVLRRTGPGWLIAGDNCPEPDGVIPRDRILGRVAQIERAGRRIRTGLGFQGRVLALLHRANLLQPAISSGVWLKRQTRLFPGR